MLELAIVLAVAAAVVWVLRTRGTGVASAETLRSIAIILAVAALVALLLELLGIGGGPPREIEVPPGN